MRVMETEYSFEDPCIIYSFFMQFISVTHIVGYNVMCFAVQNRKAQHENLQFKSYKLVTLSTFLTIPQKMMYYANVSNVYVKEWWLDNCSVNNCRCLDLLH